MDDGGFTHDSTFGSLSGSAMDLDFMDELLYEGCGLETTNWFSSLQPAASISGNANSCSQYCALVGSSNNHFRTNIHQQIYQEVTENRLPGNSSPGNPKQEELVKTESQNQNAVGTISSLVQSKSFPVEDSELGRRLWNGPRENPGPSSSVKQRLKKAIECLKGCTKDRVVLIQLWVPVKKDGKQVLTTIDQPYLLNRDSNSLTSYRNVSKKYQFPAEEDSNESFGLPGRVFRGKLPEWTPDVRFFRNDEYPRKNHAKKYNISGSLAVPVFEHGSQNCLGVVEVVMTTQEIHYRPELENVCKALEAVDLGSSQDFCPPSVKACKEFCQSVVPEISEILGSVCKTHRLPLALTWAPCFRQGKSGCRHFDKNYAHCIATVDSACFLSDGELLRFHIACSEQFLLLGQGIVGRAFATNKQCFATDITAFSKTNYPFSHHARVFGLHAAVAIPLRSNNAGEADFVLEFFLPKECQDTEEQKRMWDLLPIAIQEACQSLHVVMDKELDIDVKWPMAAASDERHNSEESQELLSSSLKEPLTEQSSWIAHMMDAQQKGKGVCVSWGSPIQSKEERKVTTQWDITQKEPYHKQVLTDSGRKQSSEPVGSVEGAAGFSLAGPQSSGGRKLDEKRRTKTEKMISLEILRQYFAGSLKDAAKSIGVCPTTLKRICRQHGITRWPSRKIKKVGHSLKKLQLVIDSVQGAQGAIQLGSFYTTFPELISPNTSQNRLISPLKINDDSKPLNPQLESGLFSAGATASQSPSSSCSQNSGSIICCSTGARQHTTNNTSSGGKAIVLEHPSSVLKRTRSDAELHVTNHEEPKLLARSQSHKTFGDHSNLDTLPPFSKSSGQNLCEGIGFKVKAALGEEKTRFSLQPNWGFRDLQQEIAKRFSIENVSMIDLKYLDDDHDWVLLTCDADLEECKDIHELSQSHTIKISLHQPSNANHA